jgi:hypothetical protein
MRRKRLVLATLISVSMATDLRPPTRLAALLADVFNFLARPTIFCCPYPQPLSIPYTLYLSNRTFLGHRTELLVRCYNPSMTLVETTFALQSPLSQEQLRALGNFSNTYGLRRFRIDETKNQLSFEYDASRLRESEVTHVLGQAGIAVTGRVN